MNNILLLTDSYKISHHLQYPLKSEVVYSYFESRGGDFSETVFFGLQYYIKKYLEGVVVTKEKITEAKELCKAHFGNDKLFNEEGWNYILNKHNGKLPVSISAVKEGSVVPTHNVLMTVQNTDPNCYWLTNYIETLLVQVWYGTTVATVSYNMRKLIFKYLEKTGTPEFVSFKLHDFGFRGVSSVESAMVGGMAHLVNFIGTDNMVALTGAKKYYNCSMAGFSIPASEHSTITSWGKDNEADAMKNMLDQYPTGIVACVSDSYDIYKACADIWGTKLKDQIMGRDGCLVVRPDSGYPPEIILNILEILGSKFGYTLNSKGYMVLDDHIRIIQGDGCDLEMCKVILEKMCALGWSIDNIAFGMGGGLLQKLNRDTQMFAFKCSAIKIDGKWKDVYKDPITSSAKKSKPGRLNLILEDGAYKTISSDKESVGELIEVFRDGNSLVEYTLDECRARSK